MCVFARTAGLNLTFKLWISMPRDGSRREMIWIYELCGEDANPSNSRTKTHHLFLRITMSLLSLPQELIHLCFFHLIAEKPLGPPQPLITLALTCRAFNLVVSSHAFRARIFRFMFDVGAITRRLFHPRDSDLADELTRLCDVLSCIRNGDVLQIDDSTGDNTLISAYLLMLCNDGKNYAQLEHAGLDAFVDKFIRTRLWEGRETNQGWPLNTIANASALWLMWMTLTKQKLAAESPEARLEITHLILPYVVLPHRYSSASAPPNHFNLPLDFKNPYHQRPLISTAAPETPYPIYPRVDDTSNAVMPFFNSRLPICTPLITIAAKLLFVARKEIFPIRAPPHLPQAPGPGIVGATQEDYREVNRSPGARLCRVVTWNWDTGSPNQVGGEDDDGSEIDQGWEESIVWDTEWWRRLLCTNYGSKRSKYLPGDVHKLGSMRGCWHGKEYIPRGNLYMQFLRQPNVPYPGIPDQLHPHLFTESSIGLSMKPVFLDIQEHHKICECPQGSPNVSESHPYVAPTYNFTRGSSAARPTSLPIVPQSGRCGIVPIPAPLVFQSTTANNQQNQGEQEGDPSEALALSHLTPRIDVIDYGMSNAWFPGHLGGVSFVDHPIMVSGDPMRNRVICAVDFQAPDFRNVLNRPEESECLSMGGRGRQQEGQEKLNAFVYETYDPEKKSVHRGLGDSSMYGAGTNTFTSASSSNDYTQENEPHKCQRCLQHEALIRVERKKAEQRVKKMLDRGMRSYGSGGEYNWDQNDDGYDDDDDDDMDMDMDMNATGVEEMEDDDDEDEEMKDLDVDELGIDVDGIIARATSSLSTGSASSIEVDDDDDASCSSPSPELVSFGDDARDRYVDKEHRSRNYYDKCRVGVECSGVADVLLSGETGRRHAIWEQYKMYGRIRPWDGLIGILRSVANTPNDILANFFIFGYLVGENNFVGEWRVAATDPLSPTWGSAFVMSRKVGGGAGGQAQL